MINKIKIAILGVSGRTGSKILKYAIKDEKIQIVGGLVSQRNINLGEDLAKILKLSDIEIGVLANSNLLEVTKDAEIIVDFSTVNITKELIDHADMLLKNKKLIIGTTGFDNDFYEKLYKVAESNIIFQSSNMSIGIGLICEFFKKYQGIINHEYKMIINDIHHVKKKDAPSGTAIMLRNSLNNSEIQIHSSRLGDIKGVHEVIMVSECETIKLSHEVHDRKIFAQGTLKVAHWLSGISKNGLYNMADFLNF